MNPVSFSGNFFASKVSNLLNRPEKMDEQTAQAQSQQIAAGLAADRFEVRLKGNPVVEDSSGFLSIGKAELTPSKTEDEPLKLGGEEVAKVTYRVQPAGWSYHQETLEVQDKNGDKRRYQGPAYRDDKRYLRDLNQALAQAVKGAVIPKPRNPQEPSDL